MITESNTRIGSCPACQAEKAGLKTRKAIPHICGKQFAPILRPKFLVGIDTGTETGFAVYSVRRRRLSEVSTLKIHQAMDRVRDIHQTVGPELFVRVEDARLRKWIPKNAGRERLQGAGSVKRDAAIWQEFLTDLGIAHAMIAPKNNKTKVSAEYFKRVTGWTGRTSGHARDAAMLIYGL